MSSEDKSLKEINVSESGKKNNTLKLIIMYFLCGGTVGLLLGFFIGHLAKTSEGSLLIKSPLWMLVAFLMLVVSFYIQIAIHEFGHMIFGLITGYKFSSFRMGNLMWVKEEGKIRLKRFKLAGTGGQCIMIPPELSDGDYKYALYHLGGILANVITSIIALILFFLNFETPITAISCICFFLSGVIQALLNGIPMTSMQINNDGSNFIECRKSKEARRAVWIQMKIIEGCGKNKRLRDMNPEWFEMPSEEGKNNYLAMSMATFRENMLMDAHRFEEAKELIDELLSGDYAIPTIHCKILKSDRIYLELIYGGDRKKVDELYDDKQKTAMKQMRTLISVIRTEYAYQLIYEKNKKKADELLRLFDKAADGHP